MTNMTTKPKMPQQQQQPYDSCGTTNNEECHPHCNHEEKRGDFIGLERRHFPQEQHETQHHLRPILVGYAFGPKKTQNHGHCHG